MEIVDKVGDLLGAIWSACIEILSDAPRVLAALWHGITWVFGGLWGLLPPFLQLLLVLVVGGFLLACLISVAWAIYTDWGKPPVYVTESESDLGTSYSSTTTYTPKYKATWTSCGSCGGRGNYQDDVASKTHRKCGACGGKGGYRA